MNTAIGRTPPHSPGTTDITAMFRSLFIALLLLHTISSSAAETRYITDNLSLSLREEPCSDCAVSLQLSAGTPVELLNTDNFGWAQVRTPDGESGWLPSRQLMFQPAPRAQLEEYEQRLKALHLEVSALQQELQAVNGERDQLLKDLDNLSGDENEQFSELIELRQQADHARGLIDQNQELLKNNNILQGRIDVLTASNEQLQSKQQQTWFLYGGITLFLAAILATLLPHLRPRKGFSEWA